MPTWNFTQYLHQITKFGGDSKREKPSVSKILKESTKRCQDHQAPDNWKRLEHQPPGDQKRLLRDPSNTGERKVYLQTNTDGEQYIKKFDDPATSFQPENQEEQEFHTMVLHSICAQFREGPHILSRFSVQYSDLGPVRK